MTLSFPNPSRSFDEARKAVRFIGHDGMFEVPFLVEASALTGPRNNELTEGRCLAAFDSLRGSIQQAARKAYSQRRRTAYLLTAADLR